LDADIDELKQISQTLANNPRNISQSHIKSIVGVAGEAYSMVESEINVEGKVADYFIQYATDLEKVVEEEEMIHQDISKLEDETKAEAQRTGHKERIGKLMRYESGEEQEFRQEVNQLRTEFEEEDKELQMLKNEVVHTKEEIDSLIDTLTTIESYLKDLGYEKAFSKLESIRGSVEEDYEKLQRVESRLEKAENVMSEGESEAANI